MSAALRSYTQLPPEGRSPATARRVVGGAIAEAGLPGILDEALLLVTELVTNAVVHGGTDVGLEVVVDADGLWVEVSDRSPGRITMNDAPSETREGGRGVYLLDALSTTWGTRNSADGKAVWFRLGAAAPRPLPSPAMPAPPRRDLSFLLGPPRELEERLGSSRVVAELLRRVVDGLDLGRAWVLARSADVTGWSLHTSYDDVPGPDPDEIRRGALADEPPAGPFREGRVLTFSGADGAPLGAVVVADPIATDDDRALLQVIAERIGVLLRDDQARDAHLRTRGSLALLAEAGEMFAGTLDVRLAATLAAQLVVPRLATWAAVWTTYEHSPVLHTVAHADENCIEPLGAALRGPDGARLVSSLVEAKTTQRMVLLPPTEVSAALDAVGGGGEVLVLPLVARRRLLGLLVVGHSAGQGYAADEAGLLADLARVAALAMDNARLYEERTRIAQALQASLLPPELPVALGVQFGARYSAAGEGNEVGGDFYDVFPIPDDGWGITIGDVCGKGPSAAAITGIAREVLRLLSRDGSDPPVALRRLNETLLALGERGRFCTAVLGTVRRRGDGVVVRFSLAGHPPPVLLSAAGDVRFLGTSGTLLGVLPEIDVAADEVHLEAGDSLVFYTDGVTERRGLTEMFGDDNLLAALRGASGRPAGEVARLLEDAAQKFDANVVAARDDLAVFVVRATGAA